MKYLTLTALAVLAHTGFVSANNIQVANVAISDQDSVTKTANIGFDLSWENSWRLSTGPANWDAAWVFVKFHNGDNNWRHAKLAVSAAAHSVPAGATLSTGLTDGVAVGVFVHRSGNGSGNVAWSGVKMKWNYGADGVLDSAIVSVDVQAIEMVYVPQGAFYLGDGSVSTFFSAGNSRTTPYQITSAAALPIGNTAAEISNSNTGESNSIYPALLPNGYDGFYCMKYEVSQGQFVRFANMQSSFSPESYEIMAPNEAKSRQRFNGSRPDFTTTTPDRAYSSGNQDDAISAYLAWTGLRPLSQFEAEKAARGPVYPVAGEFSWGTAVVASLPYSLTADGTPSEAVSTNYNINAGNAWTATTCNFFANFSSVFSGTTSNSAIGVGPCRVGMFARSAYTGTTSARIQAGASYWGIMDLTGGVAEPVLLASQANLTGETPASVAGSPDYVVIGNQVFSYFRYNFRGSHGNGSLTKPQDWGYTSGDSLRFAGGNFESSPWSVSSDLLHPGTIGYRLGIRGVRSAP